MQYTLIRVKSTHRWFIASKDTTVIRCRRLQLTSRLMALTGQRISRQAADADWLPAAPTRGWWIFRPAAGWHEIQYAAVECRLSAHLKQPRHRYIYFLLIININKKLLALQGRCCKTCTHPANWPLYWLTRLQKLSACDMFWYALPLCRNVRVCDISAL